MTDAETVDNNNNNNNTSMNIISFQYLILFSSFGIFFAFSLFFIHTSLKMFIKNSAAENTSAGKFFLPLALVH